MNKRGISSVIGVSLIVLGAFIGTALLWAFVNKNIQNAQSEVTDPDCLTLNLEVVSCKAYDTCTYGDGWNYYEADLLVKRNVGRGNVSALRFIFENNFGISGVVDKDLSNLNLKELSSISFTEPFDGIPMPVSPGTVKVAALIGDKKDVCPVASSTASCPIFSMGPLPLGNVSNYTYATGSPGFTYNRRGGNCCQHPVNRSACYDGGDPNYSFNAQGILINASGSPGLPSGNTSVCCQYNPENGGPRFVIV